MSFRVRMLIAVSVLIALTFGIGGTILMSETFNSSLGEEISAALDSFRTVQNTLSLLNSIGVQNDYSSLADALGQMETRGIGGWESISLENEKSVIYRSNSDALEGYTLLVQTEDKCTYMTVNDDYGYGILIASYISVGEERLYLRARFDVTKIYSDRETHCRLFGTIYIIVVFVGILTAAVLSFMMTGRLRKLTLAVRKLAGGDLSTRSLLSSHDEFGQLSRDIDSMADKLQENITELESDMERQEAFMGAFAHELKTPMASIIGYADLLRQDGLDDNTRLIAANYIFSEGKRLDKLSFKLLDMLLLKNDSLSMRTVNMNSFLQEIEGALAPALRERNIRLACKGERGRAVFDPDLVKSLIYNLVDNASKAIDGEGVIAVKGSLFRGGCKFEIADNGCGMKNEELTKITEAFYRVDKSRSRRLGGAGLGLALCKEIAGMHHGSLSFISEPGIGTKVTVTLYGEETDV